MDIIALERLLFALDHLIGTSNDAPVWVISTRLSPRYFRHWTYSGRTMELVYEDVKGIIGDGQPFE